MRLRLSVSLAVCLSLVFCIFCALPSTCFCICSFIYIFSFLFVRPARRQNNNVGRAYLIYANKTHTHTEVYTHVHSHTHTKQSPLKQTLLLPNSTTLSTTISYENKHNTHTHTHECKRTVTHTYGNAAPPTHSAYACDNSDSAATPSGRARREREPSERDEKFTLAALPATRRLVLPLSLTLCLDSVWQRSNCVRVAVDGDVAVAVICCWPVSAVPCRSCVS